MAAGDDDKKAIRGKVAGIFDKMLDRYEECMHERIMHLWCMVGPEERKHRLRTIVALSVELQKIQNVSVFATGFAEILIEDVIQGDWKDAERVLADLVDDSTGCRVDGKLWEGFIIISKTAIAEQKRLAAGVRSEGN